MTTNLPLKDLFRPDEVAKYLDVNKSTIYRWIDEGKISSVKLGKKLIRIPRHAILKIMKPT